jgi:hypothetical protein
MHEPAVAYRGKQCRERDVEAQDSGSQIAIGEGHCVARTERYVIEDAAVFAQGNLAVSAAVEVVKNWPWEPATSQRPEVINADDVGRCHSAFRSSHWAIEFRTDLPKQAIIQKNHVGTDVLICPAGQSPAIFAGGNNLSNLRSTGQMRTTVPTWFVVTLVPSYRLGETCPSKNPAGWSSRYAW